MLRREDDGFSLVEIILALFLLALLALTVLPLIIGATRVSVSNKDLVAATTFANAQLAPIKAAYPNDPTTPTSCATLRTTYAKTAIPDPAETGLTADVTIGACPAAYPGTVTVTVKVIEGGTTIVTVPTRITVSLS